jgi:hypothetical protein
MYSDKRALAVFLPLGLAAAMSMAQAPAGDTKTPVISKFTGVIEDIRLGADPTLIVDSVKVVLTKYTLIQSQTRPLTVHDLQPGMNVIVSGYKSLRQGFVATKIVVIQ